MGSLFYYLEEEITYSYEGWGVEPELCSDHPHLHQLHVRQLYWDHHLFDHGGR